MPPTMRVTGNVKSLKLGDVPERIIKPRTRSQRAKLALEDRKTINLGGMDSFNLYS